MTVLPRLMLAGAVVALLAGGALAEPAVAPGVPLALSQSAIQSPKALGAATLAVTRAGARLVAVGERGTVLLSDDAGASWRQAQAVPVQSALTVVRFIDARTGWAAGHLGVILQSQDGGEHWRKQFDGVQAAAAFAATAAAPGADERARRLASRLAEEGPDKPFFDLDFIDADHGFAVGAYNFTFVTRDGGRSWTPMQARLPNPKSLHLYGVRAVGGQVFVAGEQGLLLRSADGGASFEPLPSPYKGSFFGLLAARSGTLLAYGLRGNAFRSTDQGAHWERIETGLPMAIDAGVELDGGALALLGQTGDVLISRDDGRSFKKSASSGEPVPAAGLASAEGGQMVLATLRGMRRLSVP